MKATWIRAFTLCFCVAVLAGCTGSIIYVRADNAGDLAADGSREHPFPTIAEAVAETTAGTIKNIRVAEGTYEENVHLPRAINLGFWRDSGSYPLIIGDSDEPTISADGNNLISNLILEGGSHGVRCDLEPALSAYNDASILVMDCEIRSCSSVSHPGSGIEVTADMGAAGDRPDDKQVHVHIMGNYIHDIVNGDGIVLELLGHDSGDDVDQRQDMLLDVAENVIIRAENGISLDVVGVDLITTSVLITQYVTDNLIVHNSGHGILLSAEHAGKNHPAVSYNTIADNGGDGVHASAADGNTYVSLVGNLIAGNAYYGYREAAPSTHVHTRWNNLFRDNGSGHYFDFDASRSIDSEEGLNLPIDGGLGTAQDNLVADPLFVSGVFYWMGESHDDETSQYFLSQNGDVSPAVDAGDAQARERGESSRGTLASRTTSIDGIVNDEPLRRDTGIADIGFHYSTVHD